MNNVCPNCGIAGPNLNCNLHTLPYFGNMTNPCKEVVLSQPIDRVHALEREKDLFAEIGRLNVLLSKRDKEFRELSVEYQRNLDLQDKLDERDKEIERLKGLMPPDERGPGFVGQGSWSVYAEKVVAERDALCEILAGLREKGIIDQHNRPLPLEGHHKDCGHGKDGWSLCTCVPLKQAERERAKGHHPHCGRAKPGMRSPCNCLGLYERDARNQRNLDRIFDELVEDDEETCEHGNTVCKRCGVGQPAIKTPEGKPLLPPAEFSAMRIEDNKERGITECNFQRQTGRTTAMVLKALEFVKMNTMGAVVIEVDGNRMRKHVKDLLKHYADEIDARRGEHARIFVKTLGDRISGIDVGLQLRDNVIDDMRERKPTRDPRQDLRVGDMVRFELTGVIVARQSAGIVKDYDGNDYEPIQYEIKDRDKRITNYVPYHQILAVIGEEE